MNLRFRASYVNKFIKKGFLIENDSWMDSLWLLELDSIDF